MRREGIENIRVLKMDIEGAEFAVIDRLVNSALRPRILLVEFHPGDSNTERLGKVRTLATLRKLHDEGTGLSAIVAGTMRWNRYGRAEPSARLGPVVDILEPHDVVLAEIAPGLDLDEFQIDLARIDEPVRASGSVDRSTRSRERSPRRPGSPRWYP